MSKQVTEQDWAKFGLSQQGGTAAPQPPSDPGHHHPQYNEGEIFEDHQKEADLSDRPWWQANFFIKERILFGTWDGVFTSVMINIFGVIVFLKTGWMVGEAGVGEAVLILLLSLSLAIIPVLSAIGICERCQIQSGGVYFLISHILGAQIGGAAGVLYAFGQAVACSLLAVGFGETLASTLGTDNGWVVRLFAFLIMILLVAINIAGVKWVIKLQLALLALLGLAVVDLLIGSFFRIDVDAGVVGYSSENWRNNTAPEYTEGHDFFNVFGVFFATFTGVLAGVNMSGDLKDPSRNIPNGELAAVGVTGLCCLLFILVLGGAVDRLALLTDTMIAEKVSATKILFLSGVYVSSMSSILGGLYGAPRVLQSIAEQSVIPVVKFLEAGKGANKVPVYATLVLTGVSFLFILIRDMNTLALIVSMPFLLTYSFVNYSYVSLAMTFDLQQQTDGRVFAGGGIPASYGSMDRLKAAQMAAQGEHGGSTGDLDHLFPERKQRFPPPKQKDDKVKLDQEEATKEKDTLVEPADSHEANAADGPSLLDKPPTKPTIIHQPTSWYSFLCNRWLSLIGAIVNLVIMFFIHLGFAFAHLIFFGVLYYYIGQASPGAFIGISEFSIPHSVQTVFSRWTGKGGQDELVVAPLHPEVNTFTSRLTEDNADYANRKQYHQTKTEEMDDFD